MLPLKDVMKNIMNKRKLPNSCKDAYISLIPKQDTDLPLVKNYRPISLLNNDYKLFANILANKLKDVLKGIIRK